MFPTDNLSLYLKSVLILILLITTNSLTSLYTLHKDFSRALPISNYSSTPSLIPKHQIEAKFDNPVSDIISSRQRSVNKLFFTYGNPFTRKIRHINGLCDLCRVEKCRIMKAHKLKLAFKIMRPQGV